MTIDHSTRSAQFTTSEWMDYFERMDDEAAEAPETIESLTALLAADPWRSDANEIASKIQALKAANGYSNAW
jgi:hypothetical protein